MHHVPSALLMRKADTLTKPEVVAWLKALRGHPYVEQSGFDVTSVFKIRTPQGMFYVGGVNVENRDLTTGTCGEEGAISAAVTAFGEHVDIVEGWVMGAPRAAETSDLACYPCGECRQRIAQYAAASAPIHIIGLNGAHLDTKTRAELLPNAFSFRDLMHNAPVSPAEAAPVLASDVLRRLYREPQNRLTDGEIYDWLRNLRADARVSGYNEMTIWRLSNHCYVAGVKLENAAYPSSTNAMGAAAAVMNAHYGRQMVEEAWAHGFPSSAEQAEVAAKQFYTVSGAGLQVLHQFAANGGVKLHRFNGEGATQTATLAELLPHAPAFV